MSDNRVNTAVPDSYEYFPLNVPAIGTFNAQVGFVHEMGNGEDDTERPYLALGRLALPEIVRAADAERRYLQQPHLRLADVPV